MAYVKAQIPSEVYHLTKGKNLDSILSDGKIRRFNDTECWFCESLTKMKIYMEQTVLCEGKPYYAVGGQLCRYPKFIPEDYVILKLTPCRREGNWYRWNQEVPPGSSKELVQAAKEFSALKIYLPTTITCAWAVSFSFALLTLQQVRSSPAVRRHSCSTPSRRRALRWKRLPRL